MTAKTLEDRFNELKFIISGGDVNEEESILDDLKDALLWVTSRKVGNYQFSEVDGYSGTEGGGENIDFLLKILNTETLEEEFYQVLGYYDSYDGTTIHYDESFQVFPEQKEVTVIRNIYKDANGKERYTVDVDLNEAS